MSVLQGLGEVAEHLRRVTVQIAVGRHGSGSGIIVKPDGIIVTNAHVATSGALEVQLWDGSRAQAQVLVRDSGRDLALVRIARSDLLAATLADSDRVRVGELVIAVGNPFGFVGAMTTGVVHALGPMRRLGPRNWIQAAVQLAPGNSGGPLANAQGQVVGVNTMIAGGVALAIPSNAVRRLLERGSSAPRLGVTVQSVRVRVAGKTRPGLLLMHVEKGSVADSASLLLGDILIGVGSAIPATLDWFEQALNSSGDGVLRLHFLRGDRSTIRTVAVAVERPQSVAA